MLLFLSSSFNMASNYSKQHYAVQVMNLLDDGLVSVVATASVIATYNSIENKEYNWRFAFCGVENRI